MAKHWKQAAALILIVAGLAALYWNTARGLVSDWTTDDNYSHGFLIAPLALYFVWQRRERLAASFGRPSVLGLVVVAGSMATMAAGVLGSEVFLSRVSFIGALGGTVLFLGGSRLLKPLLFPLAFLMLMIPLPAIIFNQVAFPLQLVASKVGEATLHGLAIPVLREGNVLVLANTTLEVAEACSGIRSLVSLLTLSIVYGYFVDPRGWVRTLIGLSTVPVAVFANGIRVAGTGVAAHVIGPAAAEGFFHTFSGWLVFVFAFVMMHACYWIAVRAASWPRAELKGAVA